MRRLLLRARRREKRVSRFGIIADDLTGALDTGVQFSKRRLHTVVLIDQDVSGDWDILVIDTESRGYPRAKAYEKAREAARRVERVPIYKKIDSTLRGNVGAELEAIMDEIGFEKAIVAPAFPAHGRTTVEGQQFVNGLPLKETWLATDPLSPTTDHVPSLLAQQVKRQVGHVSLEVVRRGPRALAEEIRGRSEEILVVDATDEHHLRCIAEVASLLHDHWLACGSAGLAQELPVAFGFRGNRVIETASSKSHLPVLVVAGSRHNATVEQLRTVQEELGARLVQPRISHVVDESKRSAEIRRTSDQIHFWLGDKRDVILSSVFEEYVPKRRTEVAQVLGEIAQLVIERGNLCAVLLTGGATAIHTCRACDISAIQVEEEISPGISAGTVLQGTYEGLRLVTKAGGFGDKRAIVRAIIYLRSSAYG